MPFLFVLIFLGFAAPSAHADPSQLPLFSSTSTEEQLSAIGRIRNWRAGKGGCTGVLIAPRLVLTAAHCVVGQRDSSFIFDPATLPNFKRVGILESIVHPDFEGKEDITKLYSDLAVLVLGKDAPKDYAEPIPIGPQAEPGMSFSIYGFLGPENPPMQGHPECQIVRVSPGVLGSNCVVGPGMSGSPLLAGRAPDLSVVGIIVAVLDQELQGVRTFIAEIDHSLLPRDLYATELSSQ